VAASTQNQALNALVFLYSHVLKKNVGELGQVVRAKRPARLPVVMTETETERFLSHLTGTHKLMALLMYGTGMRIIEVIRLRVKDLEFEQRAIIVRDGKGLRRALHRKGVRRRHFGRGGGPGRSGRGARRRPGPSPSVPLATAAQ
jgi:integrase